MRKWRTQQLWFAVMALALNLRTAPVAWAEPLEPATNKLEKLKQDMEKRQKNQQALESRNAKIQEELDRLQKELVDLARDLQDSERQLTRAEIELAAIGRTIAHREQELTLRHKQAEQSLAAMIRLSRVPPEAWVALPGDVNSSVRSAVALRHVMDALQAEARELKAELETLESLRLEREAARRALKDQQQKLEKSRASLHGKITTRQELEQRMRGDLEDTSKALAALSEQASSLTELMDSLAEKPSAAASKPKPSSGSMRLPAEGKLVKKFGDKEDDGEPAAGLTIHTRNLAEVVAPDKGKVVYVGPFMSYGHIVILRHANDLHSLIAGMDKSFALPGQQLLAGEPIGRMGYEKDGLTKLYVELRKQARPVNPRGYFGE